MPRWNEQESQGLKIIRTQLANELSQSPAYPEIVGDRKIIRFLRGHNYNYPKVIELMRNFLQWRKDHHVNEIRNHIIFGDCNHPSKFPKGDIILSHIKQIIIAPDAMDKYASLICFEQYNFSPSELLHKITLQEYVTFMIYCLEYRSIILDQISEEREQAYLQSLSEEKRQKILKEEEDGEEQVCDLNHPETCQRQHHHNADNNYYGVIANMCVIRDLSGVGWEHLSSKGLDIISTIVSLASNNYPELMRKCFMINVPWIFHTVWYFVKGLLSEKTIQKINVLGTSYMNELIEDIEMTSIPGLIGGQYEGYSKYSPFHFNRSYFSSGQSKLYETAVPSSSSSTAIENDDIEDEELKSFEEEVSMLSEKSEVKILGISRDNKSAQQQHKYAKPDGIILKLSEDYSFAQVSLDDDNNSNSKNAVRNQLEIIDSANATTTNIELLDKKRRSPSPIEFNLISLQTCGY